MKKLQFKGTYAEMHSVCEYKISLVEKNIQEFINYGINSEEVEQTKSMLKHLKRFASDRQMRYNQVITNIDKQNLANELRQEMRMFATLVKINYHDDYLGSFHHLNLSGISKMNVKNLITLSLQVIDTHLSNQSVLTPIVGSNIDNIIALSDKLNNTQTQHLTRKGERNISTQERHQLVYEFYSRIQKYCALGKTMFFKSNKALSQQFNLYETVWQKRTTQKTTHVKS